MSLDFLRLGRFASDKETIICNRSKSAISSTQSVTILHTVICSPWKDRTVGQTQDD